MSEVRNFAAPAEAIWPQEGPQIADRRPGNLVT
jgi:hypothetical protein